MENNLTFGVSETTTIENENVQGILLEIFPKNGSDALQAITGLNDISVDIFLRNKATKKEQNIFKGYLDDLLTGLYAQTTQYDIAKSQISGVGYQFYIDFGEYPIKTDLNTVLIVRTKIPTSAFNGSTVANSTASIETDVTTAQNVYNYVPVIEPVNIGNGKSNIDESYGDNVISIVMATDYTATYASSIKAKPESVTLQAKGGFNATYTENLLQSKNTQMLAYNPDTTVKNLVVYRNRYPIHEVKLTSKLTSQADADAKVIIVRLENRL